MYNSGMIEPRSQARRRAAYRSLRNRIPSLLSFERKKELLAQILQGDIWGMELWGWLACLSELGRIHRRAIAFRKFHKLIGVQEA